MLTRVLVIAASGAIGFLAAGALRESPTEPQSPRKVGGSAPVAPLTLPTAAESAMIGEWEQLHATHGDDRASLYAAIKDTKDAFRRRAFRFALIAEWSVRDPAAGMAFLLEKDKYNAGQLAREWLRRDPEGAIAGLLAGGEAARGHLRGLLKEIAKLAPGRLAEVLAALMTKPDRWDTDAADAFAVFAGNDLAAARAAAESVSGDFRGQALSGVAKAWGEKDGVAALAWAQSMPPGDARDAALKAVLTGWAKTDPVAALGKLDLVPPGGDEGNYGSDVGAMVLREAAKKDWDATIAWLRDNPGKLGQASLQGLQGELSRRLALDVAGTMKLVTTSGLSGLEQVFGNAVLNDGYAQRDAIWAWLESQPPGAMTSTLRLSLINAMAWKEPDFALGFLENLPDTKESAALLQAGVMNLLNGGSRMNLVDGLLEKASSKIRPLLIEAALNYGNVELGSDAPRWIARLNELPAEKRATFTSQLASRWALSDPAAAIQWASSLTDPEVRDSALSSASFSWAKQEPREAALWVNALPPGLLRDKASEGIVTVLARSEPETAWTWAMSIKTPDLRFRQLAFVYENMKQKSLEIAEQMLSGANLPASEQKALREGSAPAKQATPAR